MAKIKQFEAFAKIFVAYKKKLSVLAVRRFFSLEHSFYG